MRCGIIDGIYVTEGGLFTLPAGLMGVPRASFAQAYVVASDDPEELGIESSKAKKEAVDVVSSEQEAFAFNTPGQAGSLKGVPAFGADAPG